MSEEIKVIDIGLVEPSTEAPTYAGTVAECPTCGTSVGPLTATANCSAIITCPCGNRLEAWTS